MEEEIMKFLCNRADLPNIKNKCYNLQIIIDFIVQ
jgi:hypothetical protein